MIYYIQKNYFWNQQKLRIKVEELSNTKKYLLENRCFKHDNSSQKLKELKLLLKQTTLVIQEKKSLASSFVDYFQLCNQVCFCFKFILCVVL